MSFILDALKKSEMERQRQSVPGLMDLPPRGRRRRLPLWAAALGALLIVNLAVLGVVLWKKGPPAERVAPVAAARAAAPASAAEPRPFSPMDGPAVYAPEIPVTEGAEPAVAQSPKAAAAPKALTAEHPSSRPDPLLSEPPPAQSEELLPSMSELNLSGAQALPELHLDVHVFATKPSERFVYINMRKYHEGSTLEEGPRLERIRRDGVVLNYQGLRFLLPRQP